MKLQEIQIELAGVCDARCSYCTWEKREAGKQLMDTALAIRLLNEAKGLGVEVVRLHGVGESLLHPDLIKIIGVGESLGLNHSLSTNCGRLQGEKADAIAAMPGLHFILAVPFADPRPEFVEKCVANAKTYLQRPFTNHCLHIQMVCDVGARPYYRRFVDEFLPLVEEAKNAWLHLKSPITWPSDTPNIGFIDRELVGHPKVILETKATPVSVGADCSMPDRLLLVRADGTCAPCCVGFEESWQLGSVILSSLGSVWASARMGEIRRLWRQGGDSLPCYHCLKRTDCRQVLEVGS